MANITVNKVKSQIFKKLCFEMGKRKIWKQRSKINVHMNGPMLGCMDNYINQLNLYFKTHESLI